MSWLLDRSPMTVFRALRRLMLNLKAGRVEMEGAVEVDELYVNAGLKGRNNSIRIKHLGREPRRRAFRRRGRGSWSYDKPAFSLVEVGVRIMFRQVALRLKQPSIDRRIRENSTIYTDSFKSYLGLSGLGMNT